MFQKFQHICGFLEMYTAKSKFLPILAGYSGLIKKALWSGPTFPPGTKDVKSFGGTNLLIVNVSKPVFCDSTGDLASVGATSHSVCAEIGSSPLIVYP